MVDPAALKEPLRKFPDGTPVTCRVPGHPECDFEGVVCGFVGSWGTGCTWYDVKRKRKVERFFGKYVKAR